MASNKVMEFRKTEFEARGHENWRSDKKTEFDEYSKDQTPPQEKDYDGERIRTVMLRNLDNDMEIFDEVFRSGPYQLIPDFNDMKGGKSE
jgi:hypothetical protein